MPCVKASWQEIVEPKPTPVRLDQYLAQKTAFPKAFIQEQIEAGCTHLNGKKVLKSSVKLKGGEALSIEIEEPVLETHLLPKEGPLDILYEDEYLIVLNKPADLVVHPAKSYKEPTLVHYLLHHLKNSQDFVALDPLRPGIVHRLDKCTTGVILIAKTRQCLALLTRQFRDRSVEKKYEAIVWGVTPAQGMLESVIGRDRKNPTKISSKTSMGRNATTFYKQIKTDQRFSWVELFPKTGRTHQLRVHLAEFRHPIIGDTTYGKDIGHRNLNLLPEPAQKKKKNLKGALLHASAIKFQHPITNETLSFSAQKPENFLELLHVLGWN